MDLGSHFSTRDPFDGYPVFRDYEILIISSNKKVPHNCGPFCNLYFAYQYYEIMCSFSGGGGSSVLASQITAKYLPRYV